MWTKTEANAYLNGSKSYEDLEAKETSQPTDVEKSSPVENVDSSGANATVSETSNVNPVENEEKSTNSNIDNSPEKTNVNDENNEVKKEKHSYTAIEKQRHAWKKQKEKQRALKESLAAKQNEIDKLTERLKKYENLTVDDFKGDVNAYIDYRLGMRDDTNKVDALKKEISDTETNFNNQELEELNRQRVLDCFPNEQDRTQYMGLVWKAENNFRQMHPELDFDKFSDFIASEEDHTILNYIQDSDNAPKLIRHFIFKPEMAERIMYMRNPYNKIAELRNIEDNILRSEQNTQSPVVQPKPIKELPSTGKVVENGNLSNGIDYNKPWSKRDAENYIKNHR